MGGCVDQLLCGTSCNGIGIEIGASACCELAIDSSEYSGSGDRACASKLAALNGALAFARGESEARTCDGC